MKIRSMALRCVKAVVVIALIAVVNFFLVRMAPGDPAQVMAGQSGATDEKYMAQLRQEFGLDQSLPTQLGAYVNHLAHLDLGYSHRQQQPVLTLILDRLPATLLLTGLAFALSVSLGVLLGVLSARRAGSWTDAGISAAALLFYATPIFWSGLLLVLIFSVWLGWLPAYGYSSIGAGMTGVQSVLDIARHTILPVATLD